MLPKKDILLIKHLIINKKTEEARKILANLHPADIAQILSDIKTRIKTLFRMMSSSKAAEVLEEF